LCRGPGFSDFSVLSDPLEQALLFARSSLFDDDTRTGCCQVGACGPPIRRKCGNMDGARSGWWLRPTVHRSRDPRKQNRRQDDRGECPDSSAIAKLGFAGGVIHTQQRTAKPVFVSLAIQESDYSRSGLTKTRRWLGILASAFWRPRPTAAPAARPGTGRNRTDQTTNKRKRQHGRDMTKLQNCVGWWPALQINGGRWIVCHHRESASWCADWSIGPEGLVGHLNPSLQVALHLMMMLKQSRRITRTRSGCLSLVKLLEAGGSHNLLGLSLTHFRL